jgi:hypothetical protein
LNEWNQWNKSCIMLNILWYACLTVKWCARVLCLNVAEFHLSRFFVVCFQSLKKNLGAVFWKNVITNNQHSLFFIWFKDRDQLFLPNSGSPGAIKPLIIYLWIIIMIDFFFFSVVLIQIFYAQYKATSGCYSCFSCVNALTAHIYVDYS